MLRKDAITKHKAFDLHLKAKPDGKGRFSGYASVWDVTDAYREQVARGAFAESLAETSAKGRTLPILWQHRDEPIGHWVELREDDHGLFGEGELWIDDAPYARIAQKGMGVGAVTGLSIGYYVEDSSFDEKTRIRTLKQLALIEASVVISPANDDARIDAIKAKLAAGEHITERDFGRVLRERGFSRSDADEIATVGFKAWNAGAGRPHQANPAGMGDLVEALSGFSLPTF